ncbi:MAG TPA: hypothetical protein VFE08_11760, partial [Candidatus Sulfotelmatobacter sp.]|nr:hypothetical protein [Candidatus Sulfotelmatobacter sp.]
ASLMIGVPATWAFGLNGAIWGSNLADILSFVALFVVLRHKLAAHTSADSGSRLERLKAAADVRPNVALEIPEEV